MSATRPEPKVNISLNDQLSNIDKAIEILKRQEAAYAHVTSNNTYMSSADIEAQLVRSPIIHNQFMQVVEHFNETGELEGQELMELIRLIRGTKQLRW